MKIDVRLKNINAIQDMREAALNTIHKKNVKDDVVSDKLFRKYLLSEHSPIRAVELRITMSDIPYYVSTHFVRHVHALHYVSTNRPDRVGKERSVNDTCTHIMDINIQALIDMSRKRLCMGKVDPDTYLIMLEIKRIMHNDDNSYIKAIADYMVPNCIYRCGCPEFKPCGFFADLRFRDIDDRYSTYNGYVYLYYR